MDIEKVMIGLLQREFAWREFHGAALAIGIEMPTIELGVIHFVLDLLGVPADNTLEGGEPVYCRDWFHDQFDDIVKTGSEDECREFLRVATEQELEV